MQFNVRVYGVLLHEGQILVSDELIKGKFYTKFPGGGLEFGEGTRECLKREFAEETGLEVTVGDHLYTTDFFQVSAFNSQQQIISIYYNVHCSDLRLLQTALSKNAFSEEQLQTGNDCEIFRWIALKDLQKTDLTLPIDQVVAELLIP